MTDLNPEHARAWNRWKGTAIEWLSVIIACSSTFISIIAILMAAISFVRIGYLDSALTRANESNDLWSAHTVVLRAKLEAHGIDVPPSPEDTDYK